MALPHQVRDQQNQRNFNALDERLNERALRARLPVNVKDFGATGDGTTNDTAAVQAAIDRVVALGGGTVFFPRGDYLLSGNIYVTDDGTSTGSKVDGVTLAGEGRYNTILDGLVSIGRRDADSPNDNHTDGTPQTSNGISVRDLTIEGGLELYSCQRHSVLFALRIIPATPANQGILARYCNTLQIIDVRSDGGTTTRDGLVLETSHDVNAWGCGFNNARRGVKIHAVNSTDARATNVWFRGCHFEANNRQAILMEQVGSGGIHGCSFISNDDEVPGTYATIDLDGGAATANDVRGFSVRDVWMSAKTSGTGTAIRLGRTVGAVLGGGRITTFSVGIDNTANATDTFIHPGTVWDTITTQTQGYAPAWERTFESSCRITTAAVAGTTYVLASGRTDPSGFAINTVDGATTIFKRIVASDLAKPGMTTQLRLGGQVAVGATAPGVDVTVGLYAVSIVTNTVTPGAAVNELVLASAGFSVSSFRTVAGSSFAVPADGTYVLGVKISGAPSAAFAPQIELQMRHV